MNTRWQGAALALIPISMIVWSGGTSPLSWIFFLLWVAWTGYMFRRTTILCRSSLILGGCLSGWVLISLLVPADWPGVRAWESMLPESRLSYLPGVHAPMPWLGLESWVLLSGAIWLWVIVSGQSDPNRLRSGFYVSLLAGLTVIAGLAFAEGTEWIDIPIWNSMVGLGPFPNRNQFGFILAVGVVLAFGLILQDYKRHRHRLFFWAPAGVFFLFLIALNGSRSGLGLALAGFFILAVGEGLLYRTWKHWGVVTAFALVLTAAAFLVGGDSVERIVEMGQALDPENPEGMGRAEIHRDAMDLIAANPVWGVGSGQFAHVFPLYRESYQANKVVLHPESDWIWLTAESGLPALGMILLWVAWTVRRMVPTKRTSAFRLKWLGMTCGLLLVLHGWVDVSAHRPGSGLTALLCLAVALPAVKSKSRWKASRLTMLSAALCLPGMVLLAIIRMSPSAQVGYGQEKALVESAAHSIRNGAGSTSMLDDHLAKAPLNAKLHFWDGIYHLRQDPDERRAQEALETAAALSPYHLSLLGQIGAAWAGIDISRAAQAWETVFSRSQGQGGQVASELIREVSDPAAREALWMVALNHPDIWVPVLRGSSPSEAKRWTPFLAKLGPPGDEWQTRSLLQIWRRHCGLDQMMTLLRDRPAWRPYLWSEEAQWLSAQGEFQEAASLLRAHLPEPALPIDNLDADDVQRARETLLRRPQTPHALAIVSMAQFRSGQFRTLLRDLTPFLEAVRDAPPYLYWLGGEAAYQTGDWKRAVDYWKSYEAAEAGRQ